MNRLHFVQIDEFYPMDPGQHNSFTYYVEKFYLEEFGLDRKKALLIDCTRIGIPEGMTLDQVWPNGEVDLSLRYRHPADNLQAVQKQVLGSVDQWCSDYEEKIAALGGIGFFLGGIGPDGHIAFNITGSDHHSSTRLTPTNYETQAAAATDLGGIEVASKRHAITIGLKTITRNPECTAIIMAAGEAKARVVRNAVCEPPHIRYPATVLHTLPNARFYVTRGAARLLDRRRHQRLLDMESLPESEPEKIVIDLAMKSRKRILDLKRNEFVEDSFGSLALEKLPGSPESLIRRIHASVIAKLEAGTLVSGQTRILHTAPHHDDIMLGYFPYVVRHIRDASNHHTFAYMTSGFTAVTNAYALEKLENLLHFLKNPEFTSLARENYFDPANDHARNRDVWQYLDGVAANDMAMRREGESRRLFRNLIEIFEEEDVENLEDRINELTNYFRTQYAGKKDLPHIQKLKGMIREWEADCLWGYLGFDNSSIKHLRLGFYQGNIFTEEPTLSRDVDPIVRLIREVRPDVVTVALDPEGSGPDTHYKVLQAVAQALRIIQEETGRSDIQVLGYRNVWYRFHPSEANIFVPVSLNMFALKQSAFADAFVSQKDASFPSYEYDGPFSRLAQQIQVEQYQMLKTCLGRRFFNDHPSPLIRGTRGFVFLRKMSLEAFFHHAREIRERTESIQ
jgi:glucosamine-6-phosphate deaminase